MFVKIYIKKICLPYAGPNASPHIKTFHWEEIDPAISKRQRSKKILRILSRHNMQKPNIYYQTYSFQFSERKTKVIRNDLHLMNRRIILNALHFRLKLHAFDLAVFAPKIRNHFLFLFKCKQNILSEMDQTIFIANQISIEDERNNNNKTWNNSNLISNKRFASIYSSHQFNHFTLYHLPSHVQMHTHCKNKLLLLFVQ